MQATPYKRPLQVNLGLGEFVVISDPIKFAVNIVAAFVSHNSLPAAELPALIESIHAAGKKLVALGEVVTGASDLLLPAVSIRKSVFPEYLICLEDGRRYKSMRRHLAVLGMTPEQYRAKWGLPSTYPMVAPNYAAQRSALAKRAWFGRKITTKYSADPAQPAAKREPGRPRKPTA
jgi:predicted transcriptional regulator